MARRDPNSPLVFHRNGIPIRCARPAWRTACQAAGVPTRCLHECRRTAARTLIRASVPERGVMRLTGHTSRTIFDRDPIIHEQELLKAEDELVASLARQAQAPRRRAHRTDKPCIGVDDARPDHRGGESHAARFGGAHPASESCDGVAGEGAPRQSCRIGQARESRDGRGTAERRPTRTGMRSRRVRTVSMARSEYRRYPPRRPLRKGVQAAIASDVNHTVTSPRRTRARL